MSLLLSRVPVAFSNALPAICNPLCFQKLPVLQGEHSWLHGESKCSGSMVPTSLHHPFPHACLPPPPIPPFLQASRCWVSASHLAMSTEVGPTSWRLLRHPHPQGHRSLLQSLPRSAHIRYDTHNGLSKGVGANCSVSQPNTKPLQIICLLFDSAWLGIEPSPMHARHTLYL